MQNHLGECSSETFCSFILAIISTTGCVIAVVCLCRNLDIKSNIKY